MKVFVFPRPSERDHNAVSRLLLALGVVSFVASVAGVMLVPALLARVSTPDTDYSRISDIGQSYGAASAVISAMALGVVLVGLTMQHRQFTRGRLRSLSDAADELVQLAMDNPVYRQCWGSRVSPDGIDEALFYYCNRLIRHWKTAWELGDLSETQARGYLASFFDSEISRLFWQMHGNWHMQVRARNRRERFLALINEEYLRAIRNGPPSRPLEACPTVKNAAKARRQRLLEADQVNGRPIVP